MLTPSSRRLLAELPDRSPPFEVAAARAAQVALMARVAGPRIEMARVDEMVLERGPEGPGPSPLRLRRYRPHGAGRQTLVFLHGGGWVHGSMDTYDDLCRALADRTRRQVIFVDYRLAPEHRYPAGLDDAVDAWRAIARSAGRYDAEAGETVLCGDSAGAHLAVAAVHRLEAAGEALPRALLLFYPVADARMATDSWRRYATGHYLTAAQMAWFWDQFAGPHRDPADPMLSPVLSIRLGRFPPTCVQVAECDLLHDEGADLAAAISAQGGRATLQRADGMLHGFLRFRGRIPEADRYLGLAGAWLDGLEGGARGAAPESGAGPSPGPGYRPITTG